MIAQMMSDNVSAYFAPNLPSSDAKTLSLFLSHSFMFSGLPPALPEITDLKKAVRKSHAS